MEKFMPYIMNNDRLEMLFLCVVCRLQVFFQWLGQKRHVPHANDANVHLPFMSKCHKQVKWNCDIV